MDKVYIILIGCEAEGINTIIPCKTLKYARKLTSKLIKRYEADERALGEYDKKYNPRLYKEETEDYWSNGLDYVTINKYLVES